MAYYVSGFFTRDPGSDLGREKNFCPLFLSVPPTKLPLMLLISVKEGRKKSNPACQVCCWTNALFMCLCQRVVSLMCRNEPGELWRYHMLCLAVQWFVLVAAAVPKFLCKMQSYHVKTVGASCLHCFLGCRFCYQFMFLVFISCYWKILMSWKSTAQSHFKSF